MLGMSRKDYQTTLKQLRIEGHVTEGFNLNSTTPQLHREYLEAKTRKQAYDADLMAKTAACKEAYEARQAAQVELDSYIEDQALEIECNVSSDVHSFPYIEYTTTQEQCQASELTCDVADSWYGSYCDIDFDEDFNWQRFNGSMRRVIKELAPPDKYPPSLLRSLRVLI